MSDTDEALQKVRGAFQEAFDVEPELITLETTAKDIPSWDSVGHLSLAANLEQAFGISLDVDELMAMESVGDIVRIVTANLAKKA